MTRASRRRIVCGGGPGAADVDRPGHERRAAQLDHQLRGDRLGLASPARAGAPSRTGSRPRCAARACSEVRWMLAPSQLAASISTRVVSACDLGARAAHHAGDRGRAVARRRSAPSRRRACGSGRRASRTCSPSRARRTVSSRAGDAVEVERVQRLAGEQHHVVGDVDDVGDRALPGGHQPRLQPRRRGADLDVLEHPRGEARAQVRALDGDLRRPRASPAAAGVLGPRRRRQRRRRWRRGPRGRRRRSPGSRAGWG